jgi:uncharacterized protein YcbK (DUF882 family)
VSAHILPALSASPEGACAPRRDHNRRRMLQYGCAAALAQLGLHPPAAGAGNWRLRSALPARPRMLWVTRPQTQESVRAVYWADARLQPEGYAALNRIYRDVHANAEWPIALGLLDLNYLLQSAVRVAYKPRPLILLSGFRTRATNRMVGGTEPNLHGAGQADDFVYEGLSLHENYRLARIFQVGGLGLYPDRGSLHKDLGRRRSWVTAGR